VRRRRRQLLRRPTVSPVVDVTDADFAAVVGASALPAIVDCWAEWCEPCKVMSAYVEFLATDFAGQVDRIVASRRMRRSRNVSRAFFQTLREVCSRRCRHAHVSHQLRCCAPA
jgi:thioredoxin-like negative regulator of GroEL